AFVRRERLPSSVPVGFPELAPDLVVEVLSPDDRPGETLAKVGDWLEAGARLVWVIDPQGRNARVYRADGSQTSVSEADHLEGALLRQGPPVQRVVPVPERLLQPARLTHGLPTAAQPGERQPAGGMHAPILGQAPYDGVQQHAARVEGGACRGPVAAQLPGPGAVQGRGIVRVVRLEERVKIGRAHV